DRGRRVGDRALRRPRRAGAVVPGLRDAGSDDRPGLRHGRHPRRDGYGPECSGAGRAARDDRPPRAPLRLRAPGCLRALLGLRGPAYLRGRGRAIPARFGPISAGRHRKHLISPAGVVASVHRFLDGDQKGVGTVKRTITLLTALSALAALAVVLGGGGTA